MGACLLFVSFTIAPKFMIEKHSHFTLWKCGQNKTQGARLRFPPVPYWVFVPLPSPSARTVSQLHANVITMGAFHLVKISGISGSAVNGTRFVGSSHWKIPRKSGKSKKVGPFSRSCSIYVSRSLYQFQVHGRAPPRTGVYDQMEQLFTNRKFHFCYHRNFRVFFLNGKRPIFSRMIPSQFL